MLSKRQFYFILHVFFLSGLIYAFNQFITTPKINIWQRRLWAYENWIIFSFYGIFLYLTLTEKEIHNKLKLFGKKKHLTEFRKILSVKLVLLAFPWGLFLIFAPKELLSILKLNSIYWRILGFFSLIGAAIYYFPYHFYKNKLSYYIFLFGIADNVITGFILTFLFIKGKVPLTAWSTTPLLFYFAYFFWDQSKKYR